MNFYGRIRSNNAREIRFNFNEYNAVIRKRISESKFIIDESRKRLIKVNNPTTPKLYGLPKLRKNGIPMRPIISFVSAPSYHLCKHLNKWFHSYTSFLPKYAVSNSCDPVGKITNLPIPPNSILVSFDVVSLYTNVPIQPTLTRVSEILEQHKILPPVADECVSLLKTCLEPNICQFNNEIYKFVDGLPLGSPTASLMANIFMDSLENMIFSSNHNSLSHVIYWFR